MKRFPEPRVFLRGLAVTAFVRIISAQFAPHTKSFAENLRVWVRWGYPVREIPLPRNGGVSGRFSERGVEDSYEYATFHVESYHQSKEYFSTYYDLPSG